MTIRRCFIVGCPRSGTTLLQSMLAAHPEIVSFPETNFVNAAVGDFQRRVIHRTEPSPVKALRTRLRLALGLASGSAVPRFQRVMRNLGRDDLAGRLSGWPVTIERAVRALVAALDRLAEDAGSDFWINKTPTYYAYLDYLERYCPGARYVHVVRPGADVVASLTDAARRYPDSFWARDFSDVDNCVRCWNGAVSVARSRLQQPDHYVVRFDALLADTETELRALADWLGVGFDPRMLSAYGSEAQRLTLDSEKWKAGAAQPLSHERKFERLFTPQQRSAITERLDSLDWLTA